MSYPVKPEVCIIGDRLAVFMGADYKLMELDAADKWVRRLQGELAKLRREVKRKARASTLLKFDGTNGNGYQPAASRALGSDSIPPGAE